MVYCAWIGCNHSSNKDSVEKNGRKSFFRFPKDLKLRKQWEVNCRRDFSVSSCRDLRLCEDHFEPHMFQRSCDFEFLTQIGFESSPRPRKYLVPGAVPMKYCLPLPGRQTEATHRGAFAKRRRIELLSELDLTPKMSVEEEEAVGEAEAMVVGMDDVASPQGVGTQTSVVQHYDAATQFDGRIIKLMQHYFTDRRDVGVQTDPIASDLDSEDLVSSDDENIDQAEKDPDYSPFSKPTSRSNIPAGPVALSDKAVVYITALEQLGDVCRVCLQTCVAETSRCGSCVKILFKCPEGHTYQWCSQPLHNRMPLGNLELAAAVLFTGSRYTAAKRFFDASRVLFISHKLFYDLQRSYLEPAVERLWMSSQQQVFDEIKNKNRLVVGGDARCDSPGHSAKYGSYSLMDLDSNKILDVQLIQCNEVRNSNAMELEGLRRCFQTLHDRGIKVTDVVTDRHVQVRAYLKREDITHWFDVWHIAKGVGKKISAAAKKGRYTAELVDWQKSITNHLFWSICSSDGDGDLVVAKWQSCLNHISNIHDHDSSLFPHCCHEEMDDNARAWIGKGSRSYKELESIVCSKHLLADIRQGSHHKQTSALEAYHKVVCGFAPKFYHFFFQSMRCRLLLAALHTNENVVRAQACTVKDGTPRYKVRYPKANGGNPVASAVKPEPTYDYVAQLMTMVLEIRYQHPGHRQAQRAHHRSYHPPLVSAEKRMNKADVVKAHQSRFNP